MTIRQIIDKVNFNQLFVPAFQREYVWKREQAKNLIDSLIKKYPTGTLLTWETNTPPELKGNIKYNPLMGAVKLILDGQQRVTTLFMIMTGEIPPYYTSKDITNDIRNLYINLLTLELEYYKPKTMGKNPIWVNLTDIFKGDVKSRTIIKELEKIKAVDEETEDILDENLSKVKAVQDREFVEQIIPVTANVKNAIDIFYIVNSSGVSLTDAELALAQISGYWPEAREIFKKKLESLSQKGFVFKLDFIIYVLLGALYYIGSDMTKLHNIENLDNLKKTWKLLDEKIIDYVLNILQSHAYVDHSEEINSPYALVPLMVFVYKNGIKLSDIQIKKAIKWFYYSQIRQRYVSQLPAKLDKDLSIIKDYNEPFDILIENIGAERNLEISENEFVGHGISHPLFEMMKWYFKSKGAVCFGTGLGIRKNMGKKYELENDHIFAYSVLKVAGYDQNNRHKYQLAQEMTNRAILTQVENRDKHAKKADIYLTNVIKNFPKALELQCVPVNQELWKVENYEDFLINRRKILATELNSFLNNITSIELSKARLSVDEMIEQGEHSMLEFKSTLRWDVVNSVVNKVMEDAVMKCLAAFSNSDGGTLVIGVDDDGNILGLENDYNSLDGDKDEFEIHLRNLVNKYFGVEFAANNLVINFTTIIDKEVCVIDVKKNSTPVYSQVTDKTGQKVEKFYVRSGNSSIEINKHSEIVKYIKTRFNS